MAIRNVAEGMLVRASAQHPEDPPGLAVDGGAFAARAWNAGEHPPQWIEIDLIRDYTVYLIDLVVEQFPEGETKHEIWGGAAPGSDGEHEPLRKLDEFGGWTFAGQLIRRIPQEPTAWDGVRYLRIVTTASPSWVSWREIRAYSE